jgi:hypothetical protein
LRSIAGVCLLAFGIQLVASELDAGGDAVAVNVTDFKRGGQYAATFSVNVVNESRLLADTCATLQVRAEYRWWKWWWDDRGGRVSFQAQARALDVLEQSATRAERIAFGYMGQGWSAPDPTRPCNVVSHALVEYTENPIAGTERAVLSYYAR